MRRELRSTQADFEEKARTEDVEQLWSTFKEKIHTLIESYIPSKIVRRNREHKPWISRQVKTLLRKSKKLFQRQRRTGKVRDIRHYKETKARLQKAERQSYWQFVDNIIEVGDADQDQQPKQKRSGHTLSLSGKLQEELHPLRRMEDSMLTQKIKPIY